MITKDDMVVVNIYHDGYIAMWRGDRWPTWMEHKTVTQSSWNRLWYVLSKWESFITGAYCHIFTNEQPSPNKRHYISITFKNPDGTMVFENGVWKKKG